MEAKNIFVSDELDKAYGSTMRPKNRAIFEHEAFSSACAKLEPEDRAEINSIVRQFTGNPDMRYAKRVKNIGSLGILELLAKLGIWLSAVERERP